ncbi:transglutaminase-like cysteine peptidase [Kordiimonas aquimaris]|uniref:transglutaminase-like cysteine peptidase n=1 Tax=Kordiimonas aquimaris TaxID=707591 RepID=UPI0021D29FA0|nr:transglutaminase-like cysteine peptidase [Kordiimonas aquimaris]
MAIKIVRFLIQSFVLMVSVSACQTVLPASTSLPVGSTVAPPLGYDALCARTPSECVLPISKATNNMVGSLLIQAKSLVIPTWEEGGGDYWQSLTERGPGDCEDFALTLRRSLREVLPEYAGAFRLATAYTETMQYHAVLTIETSQGTVVCDIRFPQCADWKTFPYKWHLREVVGQRNWQDISGEGSQFFASVQSSMP